MKYEDIEVSEKYVFLVQDKQMVGVANSKSRGVDHPEEVTLKNARGYCTTTPENVLHPYTDIPRRSVDELKDYAESTDRKAHREVESHGGFECVWRVRCTSKAHRWSNSYLAQPVASDYAKKEHRRIGPLGLAVVFTTQSDAIAAAESAGWYVDGRQALCPECRDEMTTEEEEE